MNQLKSTNDVLRELDSLKQELSKLKLDKESVLEEKIQAENRFEAFRLKNTANLSLVDALKNEIEKINEERKLAELSRVKCLEEFESIQAQKKDEFEDYLGKTEEVIKKVDDINELESKLLATNLEVDKIRIELELVKKNEELVLIKEESFKFMKAMDLVRIELKKIKENISSLKKAEEISTLALEKATSKLLRAELKLEETIRAEQRVKSLATDMSLVLQQLKKDAKNSTDEAKLIQQECSKIKDYVSKMENRREFNQRKLDWAMRELEAAKSSESKATSYQNRANANTLISRIKKYHDDSRITISNLEYSYLKEREAQANENAGKKAKSAGVSMLSLIAKEDEIEVERMKNVRGNKASPKRTIRTSPRRGKFVKGSSPLYQSMTSPRRGKFVKGSSPLYQNMHTSPVFVVRKKREVMPSLAKFFTRKNTERGL